MSTANVLRSDGRTADELRALTIVYESLDRVDGSARFGFGPTQSLTSVSGPIEIRPNLESPSQATLDIQIRPLASVPGTDSKALATTLKSILTPALLLSHHPRTLVQIVGQALCGTGSGSGTGSVGRGWNASLIASLVNASVAALMNATSVPMKGIVCAVAVGLVRSASGGVLVLDPSESELAHLTGGGCFAFLFSATLPSTPTDSTDIPPCSLLWTNYTSTSPFDERELSDARTLAEKGAREVWKALKESVGRMEAPLKASDDRKASTVEDIHAASRDTDIHEEDDVKMEV
ncbi:Exosome complex component Rrp41 [Grifola frondosa]|uniref:Exosome complex component Rrp41 n=1 Tax=Grifola frondosa TaxID=5627 RepID=A0A1C7LSI0_GRIFR|nr:Exosome complex component Rrp41 [Grifola frondosa]